MNISVGAYAAAAPQWDTSQLAAFYRSLFDFPGVSGLELPTTQFRRLLDEPDWLNYFPEDWCIYLTELPATVGALNSSPDYGLASTATIGRQAAVDAAKRAIALANEADSRLGRRVVEAVVLPSAPTRDPAAPLPPAFDALRRSLAELVVDTAGPTVLLEHCDAAVFNHPAAKGFLPFETDLAAVSEEASSVRVAINWGRSVIESREPRSPIEQVKSAALADRLGLVVFSGVSAKASQWGRPWADAHLPPSKVVPEGAAEHDSLMDASHMTETLRVAGTATAIGLKVSVRPKDAPISTRLQVIRDSVAVLGQAHRAAWPPPTDVGDPRSQAEGPH